MMLNLSAREDCEPNDTPYVIQHRKRVKIQVTAVITAMTLLELLLWTSEINYKCSVAAFSASVHQCNA